MPEAIMKIELADGVKGWEYARNSDVRTIVLVDQQGEYEPDGQVWAEFITNAPDMIVYGCADKVLTKLNPEDEDYLEDVEMDIRYEISKIGYLVADLPLRGAEIVIREY